MVGPVVVLTWHCDFRHNLDRCQENQQGPLLANLMSKINQYYTIIETWKRLYGTPEHGPFRYDPTELHVACAKCGKVKGKMSRHHKGNDFFFALYRPDLYAYRYMEFRKEDVVKLCNVCHRSVERYYDKLKKELYADYNARHWRNEILTYTTTHLGPPSQEWCETWRAKFVAMFDKWIKKPVRKKKRKHRSAKV